MNCGLIGVSALHRIKETNEDTFHAEAKCPQSVSSGIYQTSSANSAPLREDCLSFPLVGELQGALADGFAEGLVRGDGVEPIGLRLVLVSQEVNQIQSLTLRSQLGLWSAPCQRSFGFLAERLSLDDMPGTKQKSKGCAKESKAVLTHSSPNSFPFAGELQGALADGFAEGLVGGDGVEPFGLRLDLVSQSSPVAPRQESRALQRRRLRDQPARTSSRHSRARLSCRGATGLLPFAGELRGALTDPPRRTEGLVGGDGVESAVAELRLVLVSQEVNQTQRLTLCSLPLTTQLAEPCIA